MQQSSSRADIDAWVTVLRKVQAATRFHQFAPTPQPLDIPFPVHLLPASDLTAFKHQLLSTGVSDSQATVISDTWHASVQKFNREVSERWRHSSTPLSAQLVSAIQSRHHSLLHDVSERLLTAVQSRVNKKSSKPEFHKEFRPFFEVYFSYNAYPSLGDRARLAKLSGNTKHQVDIWFQNERARAKRSGKSVRRLEGDTLPHDYNPHQVEETLKAKMGMFYVPPDRRRKRTIAENIEAESISPEKQSTFESSVLNPLEIDRSSPDNQIPQFTPQTINSSTPFTFTYEWARVAKPSQCPPAYTPVSRSDFEDLSNRFTSFHWHPKQSASRFDIDCRIAPHPAATLHPEAGRPLNIDTTRRVHTPLWMKPAELPVIAQSRLSSSPPPSYPSLPPAYSSPSPSESSIPLLAPSSGKRRKTAGLPKRALATTAIPNSRTPSLSSSCSRKSSSSSLWSLASFPDSPSPATPVSPLSTFSAVSPGATRFSEFADVETSWEKASRLGSKIPAGSMFSSFEPLPRTPPTNLLAGRTERFDFSFDSQISQVDPALAYPDLAAIDTSAPTQYAPMGVFDQTSSINSPFGDVTSFDGIVNFSFDGSFSHPSMLQSQSGSMDDLSGLLSSPGLDLSNSMFQASSSTFGLPPLGLDLNLDDIFTMDLQQQQTIPSFDSPSWQIHSSTADITGNVTVGSMPIPDVSSSVFYNPDCVNAGFISAF